VLSSSLWEIGPRKVTVHLCKVTVHLCRGRHGVAKQQLHARFQEQMQSRGSRFAGVDADVDSDDDDKSRTILGWASILSVPCLVVPSHPEGYRTRRCSCQVPYFSKLGNPSPTLL